jgi:hypothetical protein
MSRWLQVAKLAYPPHDNIDLNDKNGPDRIKSILSILSEGGKTVSEPAPATLPASVQKLLDPLDADDLWMQFEERAAILEFDGGHSREEAERLAHAEIYGDQANG